MKIKICGTRRADDIECYNRCGIDYAGFIFAQSPRQVTVQQAAELIEMLSRSIAAVGVFVNADADEIVSCVRQCGFGIVQLHGDEPPELAAEVSRRTGCELWRAVRVRNRESLDIIKDYPADRFLLDAYSAKVYGGAGKSFDWRLLQELDMKRIILAGGLNADNVKEAKLLGSYALDLNSGVETDGYKDAAKIARAAALIRE